MAATDTTILFVGDMHLGRLPSRVPIDAGGRLPSPAELGPGAAWRRTAQVAVELGVDAVALAGDVLHGANDLFEGAHELAVGLELLAQARIPVVAVAGNHDTHVLPDLARRGALVLLGEGGTWGTFDLAPSGRAAVRLVGWSFPAPRWEASPLAVPPPPPAPGLATLGLLHADLDVPGSRYAPVMRDELAATGYAAWFLGHVHRPDAPTVDGAPFYLGSLTGLDPSETGRHGPVLVRVGAGRLAAERLPLAPLLWLGAALDKPLSPAGEARSAFHNALYGRTPAQRRKMRAALLAVSIADLQRVAVTYLRPDVMSLGVVAPHAQAAVLEGLGFSLQKL